MYICKEGNQPNQNREDGLSISLKMVEGLQPQLAMHSSRTKEPAVFPNIERKDGVYRKNDRKLNSILRITKSVWLHKYAWPFYEPVDAISLHIPQYYEIITHPMDLGSIKKRLENNYYNNFTECLVDFRLMFNNCYRFNDKKTDIYQMAQVLENFLKEKLKSGLGYDWTLMKDSSDPAPTLDPSHGKEKLVKSQPAVKRSRDPSVSSESDASSSSSYSPQAKKPNLMSQKTDVQKENKPDPRKEEERNQHIIECFKLLKKYFIKKNKYVWPFDHSLGPSWEPQAHPNNSIKEVKRWLKKGLYKDIRQFCADMICIAKTNGKYHYPWTSAHKMAAVLVRYISSKNFKYKVAFKPDVAAPPSPPIKIPAPQLIVVPPAKPSLGQNINHNNQSVVVPSKKRGRPKKVTPAPEDALRPMTQKESEELNVQLSQVSQQVIYQIVELVRNTQPELVNNNTDAFEVDFENCKPILQWEIKSLIERNNAQTLVSKEEAKPQIVSSSHPNSNIPTQPVINDTVQTFVEPVIGKPTHTPKQANNPCQIRENNIPSHRAKLDEQTASDSDGADELIDVVTHTPEHKQSPDWEPPKPQEITPAASYKSGNHQIADQIIENLLKKNNVANITDKIRQAGEGLDPPKSQETDKKIMSSQQVKCKIESHKEQGKSGLMANKLKTNPADPQVSNPRISHFVDKAPKLENGIKKNENGPEKNTKTGAINVQTDTRTNTLKKLETPIRSNNHESEKHSAQYQVDKVQTHHTTEKNGKLGNHLLVKSVTTHKTENRIVNQSNPEKHRSSMPSHHHLHMNHRSGEKARIQQGPPKHSGDILDMQRKLEFSKKQNGCENLEKVKGMEVPKMMQDIINISDELKKEYWPLYHSQTPDEKRVLHINESLIESSDLADYQMPALGFADKEKMKEMSRLNRQKYAKLHHVNFCTNAETQDFFDSLGLTHFRPVR